MPKVKWGAGDAALTAHDIDEAETGFVPYAGDIPASGVYRFKLERAKLVEFSTGSMGLKNLLVLDGSWKAEHAKYDGCPLWENVVMGKTSAGFVKAFVEALGVTSRDIMTATVTDDEGQVLKIGPKKISGQDIRLYVNVRRGRQTPEDAWRLEKAGVGYLPPPEPTADGQQDEEDAPTDPWAPDGGNHPAPGEPKAGKKPKATKAAKPAKAGKKGKDEAESEPPF